MERWVLRPIRWRQIYKNLKYLIQMKNLSWCCLRPLPVLALAAATGVFSGDACPEVIVPMIFTILVTLICRRISIRPVWLPKMIILVFSISALNTMLIVKPARDQAYQMADETMDLQGIVLSVPESADQPGPIIIRQFSGVKIMLYLQPDSPKIWYGDRIAARVHCRRPDFQRNPGGFSEKNWLKSQGIFLVAHPVSSEQFLVSSRERQFSIVTFSAGLRCGFNRMMDKLLGPDQSALLAGLLIGDTSRISDKMKSDFKQSGLSHLLSVSGANVSYLLLPAGRLLKKIRFGRQIRLLALIVLLIGFGFLTGWQISVSRAILMSGFVMAGRLLHRPSDSISLLSAAALFLLLCKPLTALNLGFWLSTAATASLILFTDPLSSKIRQYCHFPEILAEAIAATASIQLIILPLLVSAGSVISLPGLIANLSAGPLTAVIIWVAAFVMPFPVFFELVIGSALPFTFMQLIGRPLEILIDLLSRLAQLTARVQFGHLPICLVNLAFWMLWFLSVALGLIKLRRKQPYSRMFQGIIWFMFKPVFAAWLVSIVIQSVNAPNFQVWFFDVGQGDAILIIGEQGETLLIDGGSPGCGVNVLIPALDALGVRQVDLAILTHGHADHAGGLIDLTIAGRIRHLAVSSAEADWARADWKERLENNEGQNKSDLTFNLIETAKRAQINVSEISGNDTIVLGRQIRLDILNKQRLTGQQTADINEFSLLMFTELAGCRILLTADCTEDVENQFIADEQWPDADILKVAHHGSRFTTSEGFLRRILPAASVTSVGPNMYGHPAPATLARLQTAGCQVHRTDLNGALCLNIYEKHWQIIRYCP
ncbi:MAG TPA: DNA internalization-related competence protein ComEC/Rec2 [Clostridiales bacterium]|nr:DNA internalization-related competence protein ComEC/Rec2 [Clostridiales bacterium]